MITTMRTVADANRDQLIVIETQPEECAALVQCTLDGLELTLAELKAVQKAIGLTIAELESYLPKEARK